MESKAKDKEAVKKIDFEGIDINGDGYISKAELKQFLVDQRMLHSEIFWQKKVSIISKKKDKAKINSQIMLENSLE